MLAPVPGSFAGRRGEAARLAPEKRRLGAWCRKFLYFMQLFSEALTLGCGGQCWQVEVDAKGPFFSPPRPGQQCLLRRGKQMVRTSEAAPSESVV